MKTDEIKSKMYVMLRSAKRKIKSLLCIFLKRKESVCFSSEQVKESLSYLSALSKNPDTSCITKNSIEKKYDLHIIIPAYNVEKYIEKCIDSILNINMSYTYFVSVVNDGSTDGTAALLAKYKKHQNIEIINQENRGFSGARNRALEHIFGEYVMFVDSDDCIDATGIEKMVRKAIEGRFDIVEGSICYIDESGKPFMVKSKKNMTISKALGNLFGFTCGKVVKAELLEKIHFPENYWFEDSIFAQIIYQQAKEAAIIADVVYYYRRNSQGISMTSRKYNKVIDSLYITLNLYKDRKKLELPTTQEYYEHILRQIQLTFKRTINLDEKARKAIFVVWCDFIDSEFSEFNTVVKEKKMLEKSLREGNYGYYKAACIYL